MLKANKKGHTPLSVAARCAHEEITLLLLQHLVLQPAFDINHPRLVISQPLLCCAAILGLYRVAEFALDHGADPNITGPNGPPLYLAVRYKHLRMVALLCQRGANVQTRYGSQNSLDAAAVVGEPDMVKLLIRHGADVNVVADSDHVPAVLLAAITGHCDIVQLLIGAGATLDASQQLRAVRECCSRLNDTVAAKAVKVLLPHCSSFVDRNSELMYNMLVNAVSEGKLQVAKLLHAAGADAHSTDDTGTLMHYAAMSGNMAIVKWLQTLGLDTRALSAASQFLPLNCA
jgi:uncharacterized protein